MVELPALDFCPSPLAVTDPEVLLSITTITEMNMNKYGAEFIRNFWLVFGGCGSAVLAAALPDVGIGLSVFRWPLV